MHGAKILCKEENDIRDLMRRFRDHPLFFSAIEDCPQLGTYERFPKARLIISNWIDYNVRQSEANVERLIREVDEGWRGKAADEEAGDIRIEDNFKKSMETLENWLVRQNRAFRGDNRMAHASLPVQLSMDYNRTLLDTRDDNSLAPNGRPSSDYGRQGDPVPSFLAAPFDDDPCLFESLITNHLLNPFNDYILSPITGCVRRVSGRRKDTANPRHQNFVSGRNISLVAKAISYMLGNASLAAAIGTLSSFENSRIRLVALSIFGLVFSLQVMFLGKDAIATYTLTAAYFQAMIIFVGTTGTSQKYF